MSTPTVTLGLNSKLYINTGTIQSPTYEELDLIIDCGVNEEKGDADVTTRGANGWRQREPTLKDAQIDANLLDDPGNTVYQAIQTAYDDNTILEVLVLNGPIGDAGYYGLRMATKVSRWVLAQPLEEGNQRELSLIPARASFSPERIETPYPAP